MPRLQDQDEICTTWFEITYIACFKWCAALCQSERPWITAGIRPIALPLHVSLCVTCLYSTRMPKLQDQDEICATWFEMTYVACFKWCAALYQPERPWTTADNRPIALPLHVSWCIPCSCGTSMLRLQDQGQIAATRCVDYTNSTLQAVHCPISVRKTMDHS